MAFQRQDVSLGMARACAWWRTGAGAAQEFAGQPSKASDGTQVSMAVPEYAVWMSPTVRPAACARDASSLR